MGSSSLPMPSVSIMRGVHSPSINARRRWNCGAEAGCMMRGPGCAAGESGPSGGGSISALMYWWPNPGDGKAVAFCFQRQCVPGIRSDFGISTGKLLALSFDHAVEAHIIFKRIGTNNVIVVRRPQPQRDAAGLIDASRNRLEADRGLKVFT